jgi:type IX secretion system PorP/SprF family membrane protein
MYFYGLINESLKKIIARNYLFLKPITDTAYKFSIVKPKMRKILIAVMVVLSTQVSAQDPLFTQFYANPIYINPAFAGSVRCPRINMNYRNQWPGLAKTYITYSASYDQHVDLLNGGVALNILNDKAGEGTISTTNIAGVYAYQLNISRDFSVRFGLQATYVQKKLDWDKLTFGDMIDPRYGYIYATQETRPSESRSFADFSAGILAYSSSFYGGIAVHHLTQPDEAFIVQGTSELPMKITAHAGAMIPLGNTGSYKFSSNRDNGTFLSPNAIFQQQAGFNYLNLGAYILHSPVVGGLWFRCNLTDGFSAESAIALIGFQRGVFKFGYSYDITISKLTNNTTAGSHEISFGMQFECRPKKKRFRTISCPAF